MLGQRVEQVKFRHEKPKPEKEQDPKKKKRRLLLLLLLLLLLAVGGGLWYKLSQPTPVVSGLPSEVTEKMTDDELKKYADMKVDSSNVTIQVYPKVDIESDGVTGTMFAQNLPTNETGQTITLKDEATGDILYESGLLKPGYQVSKITLNKALSSGTHKGLVTVTFYDLKEERLVGQTNVAVTITVS